MAALELRMLRIDAGLTQEALAEKAHVKRATITRLEGGDLPNPVTAFAVAQVFGMKPSELWPQLLETRERAIRTPKAAA